MRAKAEAEKRPIRYDGTWRDRDASEAPAGVKPVIRFKAPQQGETVINDQSYEKIDPNSSYFHLPFVSN